MKKADIIEMIRLSYLKGVWDKENNCDQWCDEGSKTLAEELFAEFEIGGLV